VAVVRLADRSSLAARLVSHHGLARPIGRGPAGVRALLDRLRCIQLDPLEPLGSNADLVALARVDDLARGGVYEALLPGHAFEHFAKERCLLPRSAFPWYRVAAAANPAFRTTERMKRLDEALLDRVEAEVAARGPLAAAELSDHGRVDPLDWSGWKGTARAGTMALEVLAVRCRLVVAGRRGRDKVYDTPARAFGGQAPVDAEGFARWALLERVEAAGLLPRNTGPWWGQLAEVRTTLPQELVREGLLEEVTLEGAPGRWLAPAGFFDRPVDPPDDRMRLLGPLDPLLWDRALVRHLWGFDYVWEVYKPAAQRRWGWYVVPLLHRGRLVGRIDGRFADGAITVRERWIEPDAAWGEAAYGAALDRHAAALRGRSQRNDPPN
jgi:uncharacterized protein